MLRPALAEAANVAECAVAACFVGQDSVKTDLSIKLVTYESSPGRKLRDQMVDQGKPGVQLLKF